MHNSNILAIYSCTLVIRLLEQVAQLLPDGGGGVGANPREGHCHRKRTGGGSIQPEIVLGCFYLRAIKTRRRLALHGVQGRRWPLPGPAWSVVPAGD
jgi:hypothetical protein